MSISIAWASKTIYVPKVDTTLIQNAPTEIRELNINTFRLALKDLEDNEDGMVFPNTHNHVEPISVGGVTLARVVELINGYTVTFEDGQYAVNLAGANSNIGDKVNVNQVSVRSANSAGLLQTREMEYATFNGGILLDQVYGVTGTSYPIGTAQAPSNNIVDARLISTVRGINTIILRGTNTFSSGADLRNIIVRGENALKSLLFVQNGALLDGCQFQELFVINAYVSGYLYFKHCAIYNVSNFSGFMEGCLLAGTIVMGNQQPGGYNSHFVDCKSGDSVVSAHPILDMSGNSVHASMRNYVGPIKIVNCTNPVNTLSLDISSGATITLDASCTGGTVYIRGIADIINNSTMTVITDGQIDKNSIAETVWADTNADNLLIDVAFIKSIEGGRWKIVANQMVFYAPDNTTEVARFDLKDSNGLPVTNNPAERVRV